MRYNKDMLSRKKIFLAAPLVIAVAMAFVLPLVASAAVNSSVTNNVWDIRILKGPLVVCTGDGSGQGGATCQGLCDLIYQIAHVIYYFIAIVIWAVAPIMIVWSGISLITSAGNSEAMTNAKKRIRAVVVGIVIVICAYLIVSIFVNFLGINGVGGFTGPLCNS